MWSKPKRGDYALISGGQRWTIWCEISSHPSRWACWCCLGLKVRGCIETHCIPLLEASLLNCLLIATRGLKIISGFSVLTWLKWNFDTVKGSFSGGSSSKETEPITGLEEAFVWGNGWRGEGSRPAFKRPSPMQWSPQAREVPRVLKRISQISSLASSVLYI